jgi:hypothetical protein
MAVDKIFEELGALLGKERKALRTGSFASLATIVTLKTALLDQLECELRLGDFPQLEAIKKHSDANQRLLESALRGIEVARARVTAIKTASASLQTYDSQGRAKSILTMPNAIERHA